MWHAARQQEKKIKELMVDHKKRAERRRAYYESRLGDPSQLLRLTGTATKLFPNAEQHYFYENSEKSLMQWQGDAETRIDRFDGRALLDYLPENIPNMFVLPTDERDLQEELNFERFRDLVENERRNVSEDSCLEEIEAEWTSLLERHKAMIKKLQEKSDTNNQGFGYDYGTEKQDEIPSDEESHHLDDIHSYNAKTENHYYNYVDDLTDKDRHTLNIMGKKYQIPDYTRLLRIAKRDREEKAQEFKESQKIKERKSRRHMSRKEEHGEKIHTQNRDSPTYEPYTDSDSSTSLSDEEEVGNFVIEFGNSEENASESSSSRPHYSHKEEISLVHSQKGSLSHTRLVEKKDISPYYIFFVVENIDYEWAPPKKLTPAEKLRLKLQMGLNKQIQVDEKKKIQKEREQKFERLGSEEIEKHLIKSANKRLKSSATIILERNKCINYCVLSICSNDSYPWTYLSSAWYDNDDCIFPSKILFKHLRNILLPNAEKIAAFKSRI
ncbi:24513_t:CDS:10 [Cetraspora pellucida]|uniref:24513_t:CDS:1 n=2 Tax=Gigasporaceae TaxID=36753 RepID=A0A9N9NF12_9GLOM|nr:24513_t:CDS:10 [Cetraspora pellucida]